MQIQCLGRVLGRKGKLDWRNSKVTQMKMKLDELFEKYQP